MANGHELLFFDVCRCFYGHGESIVWGLIWKDEYVRMNLLGETPSVWNAIASEPEIVKDNMAQQDGG